MDSSGSGAVSAIPAATPGGRKSAAQPASLWIAFCVSLDVVIEIVDDHSLSKPKAA